MLKKQFVMTAVLFSCITGAFAQKDDGKLVKFGIRAGVNFQKIYGDDFGGNKVENDFLTTYHAGITADLLVTPVFYLQPGLIYSLKGAKSESGGTKTTIKTSYVELPINLLFKPELGSGRLLLGAGPYIAYGVGGQSKTKNGSVAIERDAEFKNTISAADYLNVKSYYVKPFDYGANALVGYELYNGFSIQVNGQLGLSKINPKIEGVTNTDKTNLKNLGVGVSLGYKF